MSFLKKLFFTLSIVSILIPIYKTKIVYAAGVGETCCDHLLYTKVLADRCVLPTCGDDGSLFGIQCDFNYHNCDSGLSCNVQSKVCAPNATPIPNVGGNVNGTNCTLSQVPTAFGCVDTTAPGIATLAMRLGIGMGSGIAFLLIASGTFKMVTSQGNPEGINRAKETITSAIIGLLFVIMAVTLLQVIGFDILGLGTLGLGTR
jgi:hypothetical protein